MLYQETMRNVSVVSIKSNEIMYVTKILFSFNFIFQNKHTVLALLLFIIAQEIYAYYILYHLIAPINIISHSR